MFRLKKSEFLYSQIIFIEVHKGEFAMFEKGESRFTVRLFETSQSKIKPGMSKLHSNMNSRFVFLD